MTLILKNSDSQPKMPKAGIYKTAIWLYAIVACLFLGGAIRAFIDGHTTLVWTFVGLMISCVSFALAVAGVYQTQKQAHEDRARDYVTREEIDLLERLEPYLKDR